MRRMLEQHPGNIAKFKQHMREAAIIVDYQVSLFVTGLGVFNSGLA